jgi:hypothetical protein
MSHELHCNYLKPTETRHHHHWTHRELTHVNSQVTISKAGVDTSHWLSCVVETKLLHFTPYLHLTSNRLLIWMEYWRMAFHYMQGRFVSYLTMSSLQILTMRGTKPDDSCTNVPDSYWLIFWWQPAWILAETLTLGQMSHALMLLAHTDSYSDDSQLESWQRHWL